MNKNTLPQNSGADKVTFSNITPQLGQSCHYIGFTPMPRLRPLVRPFATPGIHDLAEGILGMKIGMEVHPPKGDYQLAQLTHKGQMIALFHVGFTAASASYAWHTAHSLHRRFVEAAAATGSKEVAEYITAFFQTNPELTAPTQAAMLTTLLPEIDTLTKVLPVLEDFSRQLFWALHASHTASKLRCAA